MTRFKNRAEAGRLLANELSAHANHPNVLVLALPRGGVPVGAEVAKKLNVPLDVFLVRKLGLPGYTELAMGAIASAGVLVLNRDVVDGLRIPAQVIEAVTTLEKRELERRERAYRDDLPPPDVTEKTVIVVDDGIATGSTMMAAVAALRQLQAARIILAAPVVAATTYETLRKGADEIVAILVPDDFQGVGQWYEDFCQTTDDEVRAILAGFNHQAEKAHA